MVVRIVMIDEAAALEGLEGWGLADHATNETRYDPTFQTIDNVVFVCESDLWWCLQSTHTLSVTLALVIHAKNTSFLTLDLGMPLAYRLEERPLG
jgi:hypothetical protein